MIIRRFLRLTQKPVSSDLPSLLKITSEEASKGLQSGISASVDLVNAYLARIEEAAEFKAVLQVNPDVVDAARQLDEERSHSGSRGYVLPPTTIISVTDASSPLHGIPILVKDNIATKDKLDVSAGSYALLGAKPVTESSLITKLRDAGVLILGKTNLSEWANFRGLNVSSGWSPRGGQTLGTYYPNSKPDGSSSESAVATALGLCTAALGTEVRLSQLSRPPADD